MKALSLWQPWASLIAYGFKRIETRSWQTAYLGTLAIHAAKTTKGWESAPPELIVELLRVSGKASPADLPHGAVVAVAELAACKVMTRTTIEAMRSDWSQKFEMLAGDWRPGRFAWRLVDVQRALEPIPALGAQGIFDIPDETITSCRSWERHPQTVLPSRTGTGQQPAP